MVFTKKGYMDFLIGILHIVAIINQEAKDLLTLKAPKPGKSKLVECTKRQLGGNPLGQ